MSLASFPGGSAAKVADLYEAAWTADSLLDLISGRVVEIRFEPQGPDGQGVEFYRSLPDSSKEFHSVKRQAPGSASAWTPYRLTGAQDSTGRSILGDLFGHLDEDPHARAVFVSQDSAGEIREISERAKALSDHREFVDALSEMQAKSLSERIVSIARDAHDAHEKLARCDFETIGHNQLLRLVDGRIPALVKRADGADFDPADVRRFLSEFAWQHLGSDPVSQSDLVAALHVRGFAATPLQRDAAVQERVKAINGAFTGRATRTLINGNYIVRHQARSIADDLIHGEQSLMLSGNAGVGKTCVLAQVTEILTGEEIPYLAISIDAIEGALSSTDLGRKLGLPTSPATVLGEIAEGHRAILCVDQVDALSFVGGRNPQGHQILEELIGETKNYPNLLILLACRSFDLENDRILKGLVEGGFPAARRIDVELLSDEDVQTVLSAAGVPQDILEFRQLELLRIPLHLYLFLGGNRSPNAAWSRRSLFDAYWDELQRRVDPSLGTGAFRDAVKSLANMLSSRRRLRAPKVSLDAHVSTLDAMASEGAVVMDDTTVSFFHATFFDYAFARGFVATQQDLVGWLLSDSQELFRRSQVRQVLEFLRDGDLGAYLDVLGRFLNDGRIRFHLKRLVLDWLGQLSTPLLGEWQILEGLDEKLAGHMLSAIYNRVPWFDLLNESGYLDEWTKLGSQSRLQRAYYLCQWPGVFLLRSEIAAYHLRRMADGDSAYRARFASRMTFGDVHHSREMFDVFLEFLRDGTLDGLGGSGGAGDWWLMLSKMSRENPGFCCEAIGCWLDRQEELDPPETDIDQIGGAWWSNFSEEVIRESASRAPTQFASEIFPRVAIAAMGEERRQWEYFLAPVRQHLIEGLSDALSKLSQEDPETLDSLFASITQDAPKLIQGLRLRAWAANREQYANMILEFLIGHQDLWHLDETRLAIQTAAHLGNADLLAGLQALILDYRPEYERRDGFGLSQFKLLSSFPSEALGVKAGRRLAELKRKFGEEAPEIQSLTPRMDVQMVPPRIPDRALGYMNDEQLLAAMQKHHDGSSRPTGDKEWDDVLFGRQLEQQAKVEPVRFFRLVTELMSSELSPKFFSHILDGLLIAWPDEVSTAELVEVILRLHRLPGQPCGLSIGRAIRQIAKEDLPESILRIITFYAIEDPDPEKDWWLNQLSQGGDRNDAPIGAAINSVRGVAVETVAVLMFEQPERSELLMDAVEAAVNDPTLSVRSVAPMPLLALLSNSEATSLNRFSSLCSSSGSILGTRYFEHYLRHFAFKSYEKVRSILLTMVNSEDSGNRLVAARLICIAALVDNESRHLAESDAERVRRGSQELRQGAAEVYARNIEQTDVAKNCVEELKRFFNDADASVRKAAAGCFRYIDEGNLSSGSDLIDAFVESAAFETQVSLLLYRLKDMSMPLPPAVLTIAERAIAVWGPEVSDIRTSASGHAYYLSELVVRLYEQTADKDTKERLLNTIDRMVELNFEGIAGGIAVEDRV